MRLVIAISAVLCFLAIPARADVCDSINGLANGWNTVANLLEETGDDEIGDLDVPRLERDVNALLGPTEDLGDDLIELGSPDEIELGEDLLEIVEELTETTEDDFASYLVDQIDYIVDTLDDIVDYCDEGE